MMQKIQRFGGAMFTPVLLFAFSGMMIGIGTLCTTEAIMGSLASPTGIWYQFWNVILQGGWTVFNQLPLLFVVGLPVGLAKKQQARCCMEALVLYLTFQYFLSTILSQWGSSFGVDFALETGGISGLTMIASIKTLDMGMIGALLISGIVIYLHNRFFDTELPEWLGTFSGSSFVVIVGFFVLLPVAFLSAWLWPMVQEGMRSFQTMISEAGSFGVWVFIFLERLLIPFGLHHLLYFPFFYDNAVVDGGIFTTWANQLPELAASTRPLKELAPYAWAPLTGLSKMFGCPGIALAFYKTAKDSKKKAVAGLLIPITLTAIFCGVTEPAIYGINLRYRKVFISGLIGSAVGGFVTGLMHGSMFGFTGSLIGFSSFFDLKHPSDLNSFYAFLISSALALVVSFVVTWVWGYSDDMAMGKKVEKKKRPGTV